MHLFFEKSKYSLQDGYMNIFWIFFRNSSLVNLFETQKHTGEKKIVQIYSTDIVFKDSI